MQITVQLSQLAYIPDPPRSVKILSNESLPRPAAEEMCGAGDFNKDICGEKKKEGEGEKPVGVKQGVTLSPNITEIVSKVDI